MEEDWVQPVDFLAHCFVVLHLMHGFVPLRMVLKMIMAPCTICVSHVCRDFCLLVSVCLGHAMF